MYDLVNKARNPSVSYFVGVEKKGTNLDCVWPPDGTSFLPTETLVNTMREAPKSTKTRKNERVDPYIGFNYRKWISQVLIKSSSYQIHKPQDLHKAESYKSSYFFPNQKWYVLYSTSDGVERFSKRRCSLIREDYPKSLKLILR